MSNVCGGQGNICCNEGYKPSEASVVDSCPVCGKDVDCLGSDTRSIRRDGKAYYFCSSQCLTEFVTNCDKYIKTSWWRKLFRRWC